MPLKRSLALLLLGLFATLALPLAAPVAADGDGYCLTGDYCLWGDGTFKDWAKDDDPDYSDNTFNGGTANLNNAIVYVGAYRYSYRGWQTAGYGGWDIYVAYGTEANVTWVGGNYYALSAHWSE